MPHLVILYTGNLDAPAQAGPEARAEAGGDIGADTGADMGADIGSLCRRLADAMLAQLDEAGRPVFPPGGVRVLAYPAAHWAVADGGAAGRAAGGSGDYAFVYLNLRMGRGRSAAVHQAVGRALTDTAREHFKAWLDGRHIGITLQIDEGPEVFDAKTSSLHPLFNKA